MVGVEFSALNLGSTFHFILTFLGTYDSWPWKPKSKPVGSSCSSSWFFRLRGEKTHRFPTVNTHTHTCWESKRQTGWMCFWNRNSGEVVIFKFYFREANIFIPIPKVVFPSPKLFKLLGRCWIFPHWIYLPIHFSILPCRPLSYHRKLLGDPIFVTLGWAFLEPKFAGLFWLVKIQVGVFQKKWW